MNEFAKDDFDARLEAESTKDLERKLTLPLRDFFEENEVYQSARFPTEDQQD